MVAFSSPDWRIRNSLSLSSKKSFFSTLDNFSGCNKGNKCSKVWLDSGIKKIIIVNLKHIKSLDCVYGGFEGSFCLCVCCFLDFSPLTLEFSNFFLKNFKNNWYNFMIPTLQNVRIWVPGYLYRPSFCLFTFI